MQNEVGASSSFASTVLAMLSHGALIFNNIFFAGALPTFESSSFQQLFCPWSSMLGELLSGVTVTFKKGILLSIFDLNNTDSARTLTANKELEIVKKE